MKKLFMNARGFGLGESLIAAGILSVALLGLGVGLQSVAKSRSLVRGVSNALAIESSLHAAIQDPTQYASIASNLLSGVSTVPTMNFQLRSNDLDGNEITVTAPLNTNIDFDNNGLQCTGSCDWLFRLRVEGRRKGGTLIPVYAMGYRIQFNSTKASLRNLGAATNSFTTADFKWMVPTEAYTDTMIQSCDTSSGEVITTGVHRESGQVSCLKVGTVSTCAADEVASDWEYVMAGGTPTRQIQMGCKKLNVSSTCPTLAPGGYEYLVNRFNPSSFEATPIGQCVFVAQTPVFYSASVGSASRSASFQVCPANYTFVGSPGTSNGCAARVEQTFLGWSAVSCPPGLGGTAWVRNVSPSPLNVSGTLASGGQQVNCTLANDQQLLVGANNWAGYRATISVSGSCVLNDSEFKPF